MSLKADRHPPQPTLLSDDYERIDTSGSSITLLPNGKMRIVLDRRVTTRAFREVMEYLYTDRVAWDRETDKSLIQETKEASQYLRLNRLELICETYLDSTRNVAIPDSKWWKNMKWAFEHLREGDFSLSDLTLICRGDGRDVAIPCHAVVVTAACKYFYGMLLGDVNNDEKRTMRIVIDDATERQMMSILRYIYTREFDVDIADLISVWMLANKFLLEDLQVECESLVMKNASMENVDDIRRLAEMVQSTRVMELCDDLKSNSEQS